MISMIFDGESVLERLSCGSRSLVGGLRSVDNGSLKGVFAFVFVLFEPKPLFKF